MLDKFRNLSDKGKMIVIAVTITVFIAAIVLLGTFIGNKEKVVVPDNKDLPYATETASPAPTATVPATETPSPSPTPTIVPSPGTSIVYGETTLSVQDQQEAQNIAKDGMLNYFKSNKNESLEATNARLSAYFAPESGAFGTESLNKYFNMPETDNENYITSEGTIDYIDPVGGDTKLYKVVTGLTYKVQFNRANETPQVLEKNGAYTVLLSKDSGKWAIVSLDDNKG